MAEPQRGEPGTWRFLALWDENGQINLGATRAQLPPDDLHAAVMFDQVLWPRQLHYVPGDRQWFAWDSRHHHPDMSAGIEKRVDAFAGWYEQLIGACQQQVAAEAVAQMGGADQQAIDRAVKAAQEPWEGLAKYAAGLRKGTGAAQLLKRLTGQRGVDPSHMAERNPRWLNAGNCMINLVPADGEQEWARHDPSAMMTYCVNASWQPMTDGEAPWARCPEFIGMIHQATGFRDEVTMYLVKVLGYCLLGANPLQLMFFMTGDTASGKSKVLEVVSTVLGEQLAYEAKPGLVTSESPHPRHEASLRGKRLVTLDETNERLVLAENQVKRLTGQSHYNVELLYGKVMTRTPVTWAMIITNNIMPTITNLDAALHRRVWVVPMGPTIPEHLRDPDIAARVAEREQDGILALLVWGCREAMKDGGMALLVPPAAVIAKTAEYQREQDTVLLWFAERCVPANGSSPTVAGARALDDYRAWCGERDVPAALGRKPFYDRLARLAGVCRVGDPEHVWFSGFALPAP